MGLRRVSGVVLVLASIISRGYAYRRQSDEHYQASLDAEGSASYQTESGGATHNTTSRQCNLFKSFIISVNSEFVYMSPKHIVSAMVNAIQPLLTFQQLPNEELDSPENWKTIAEILLGGLGVDIVIFACQECNYHGNTFGDISHDSRLGKYFYPVNTTKFFTWTKKTVWSWMFTGALLPRKSRCPTKKTSHTHVSSGNKGGVMVYVKTVTDQNIAFVGTHLDASTPENRVANIKQIMEKLDEGHDGEQFDHVYVFGDLNYRLKAVPSVNAIAQKKCRACLIESNASSKSKLKSPCESSKKSSRKSSKRNSSSDADEGCKWCYEKKHIENGICVPRHTTCRWNSKYNQKAKKIHECKLSVADYGFYMDLMMEGRPPAKDKPVVSMYDRVKQYDSLQESLPLWESYGFRMEDYTIDVPPTYKLVYTKENLTSLALEPTQQWYWFQSLVEKGTMLDSGREFASTRELKLASERVYQMKSELKKCEFPEKCMDFGWLDRLMIKDASSSSKTIVEQYRTLKLHRKIRAGDHSPIFMMLLSR